MDSQIVLGVLASGRKFNVNPFLQIAEFNAGLELSDALVKIPFGVAGASLLVLLAQVIHSFISPAKLVPEVAEQDKSRLHRHVATLGGPAIFTYKSLRLISALALVGLSLKTSTFASGGKWPTAWKDLGLLRDGSLAVFTYAFFLALVSVVGGANWSRRASTHVVFVLLAPWLLFLYRDIWPLLTYTLTPADGQEGRMLWIKLFVLTFAAVVIPLVIPRQHTPVDPEDVVEGLAPTDTASVLSLMLHSYSDPLILKAHKVDHLKIDELPPLSDENYTKHFVKKNYKYVDPLQNKKKRHIAWSLIFFVFGRDHVVMAIMTWTRVVASFLAPIGINRLLNYFETGGDGAVVKPWVWILWLFLGPMMNAVAYDWYLYIATRVHVRAQILLTQLVFDHAMRMRVKSEVPSTSSASATGTTAPPTPDTVSVVEQSENAEGGDPNSDTQSVATSTTQATAPKKEDGAKGDKDAPAPSSSAKGSLTGKLNNLVTTDLSTLQSGQNFMLLVCYVPTQIVVSVVILYKLLGWSVFFGIATMVVSTPIPGYASKLMGRYQEDKMKKSDDRVQTVTETMNVIRMIKLFGWEPKTQEQLAEKRETELRAVRKLKLMELLTSIFNNIIPLATMVVTYGTYTLVMKESLTASKVFSSMAIFEILLEQFAGTFWILIPVIQAKVSLDRFNDFLNKTELLDEYAPTTTEILPEPSIDDGTIGIRAGSFTWTSDSPSTDGTATPRSRRQFTLRIENELFFKRGGFNLVIGQTGSGKTSLLMALLGEMHYVPTASGSVVKLPRSGGVAYHAQESWVLNDTIRSNILFGSPYDEKRYNAVIEQCGLRPDLALFSAGDQTEVGEKGLTLSGGQKARVTLARAVYSSAEILLLDDVLAALDVHTAKWIVDKCFHGDLLRDRTVILVTHNIALTSPLADFVVSLSPDGRVASQGTLSSALARDKKLQAELKKEQKEIEKAEHTIDQPAIAEGTSSAEETPKADSGKLVVEEEIALGNIGWPALKLFLSSMNDKTNPYVFWTIFAVVLVLSKVFSQLEIWILGLWTRAYEDHEPSKVPVKYYLTIYFIIVSLSLATYAATYSAWVVGSVRASRRLHYLLIESILGTTLRWLDKTPISRVITRCTQDVASIDERFADFMYYTLDMILQSGMKFGAVILISPMFSIPGLALLYIGFRFGSIYMKAQLPIKRESSNAKAPVLGHFGSAIAGLASIRAYGAQEAFRKELYSRIDRYSRAQVPFYNLNRWVGVRGSALAGILASSLAAYLTYGSRENAATAGFSLTMAVGFSSMILWIVRLFNMTQVEGNSMERIQQYLRIDQEPKPTKQGEPPAYWPASGNIRVEGLSARYSADGPKVLHDLNFEIKSGERVGIVGRTGSGKSSLTLSLLRCILTEGKVYYDGIPTDSINLSALRSNITIIPQVPELLSGTLRQNLDPFSEHEDFELNEALRSAGLFSLQSEDDESRLTLDTSIAGGGNNLSVGQRQIIALARAIVRHCKLLILDEATSAIDYDTDNIIQDSLRSKLDKDVTLLTIAHRLQTIMDADKIMVLDKGQIVEFDKPAELLKNEKGFLRMLVDESGEKEKLYAMAAGASRAT